MKKELDLEVRYYHLTRKAGVEEEGFVQRALSWRLPLNQIALVLVDVWGEHYVASHLERTTAITLERIKPLLESFRRVGALVVHAPSPDCARKYPQWKEYTGPTTPPLAPDGWPPADFRQKTGASAHWGRPQDPPDDEFDRIIAQRHIVPQVEPQPGDEVVTSGDQLHHLLRQRQVLFLFYVGFAANMCVPFRDYGMRAMKQRGYEIILVEDCTTAIEVADTSADLALSRAAAVDVGQNIGYTVRAIEVLDACKKL